MKEYRHFLVLSVVVVASVILFLSYENCAPKGGGGAFIINTSTLAQIIPGTSPTPSGGCPAEDLTAASGIYKLVPGSGHSVVIRGQATYGPGFPSPLPSLGLGTIFNGNALGYISASSPFTCLANGVSRITAINNTAGGKICEARLDNTNSSTVTGSASYTLTPDANAAHGIYDFGLLCNSGCTWTPPNFQVELICGPTSP